MMTAMVMIATTFFKIPNAMGYIHLGDGFVLLAAIILQKKYACFAGGVGVGLADIYGGYAVWAPWTLVIKIVMVLIVQLFFDFLTKRASNGKHIAKIAGIPFAELFAYVLAVLWTVCPTPYDDGLPACTDFNFIGIVRCAISIIF